MRLKLLWLRRAERSLEDLADDIAQNTNRTVVWSTGREAYPYGPVVLASRRCRLNGRLVSNTDSAYEMIMRLRASAQGLLIHPRMGRPGRVTGTRELVVAGTPYILPYRVRGEMLQILHVLHGAQRWPRNFSKKEKRH